MKINSYTLPLFIAIFIIGLVINILDGNKKINNFFEIYENFTNLKTQNHLIENCINTPSSKNYDMVNSYISKSILLVEELEIFISRNNIKDKEILDTFNDIKNKLLIKKDLVDRCKTSNSIYNNTYKNILQLSKLSKKSKAYKTNSLIDNTLISLLSYKQLELKENLKKLNRLTKSDKVLTLLYKNIILHHQNLNNIKSLQKTAKELYLADDITMLNNLITVYNTNIISETKIKIFIFVFALVLLLAINIILTVKIKKTLKNLDNKTKELELSYETIDKNVIMSKTDLEGVITDASEAFCQISGYSKKEFIGSKHSIIRHKDMDSDIFKNLWTTIQEDKIWTGEVKNRKKDGTYYWATAIITPIYKDNLKIGYTSIRNDITDKIKVIELNSKLEEKVKLEVEKNRKKDQQVIEQSRLAQMGEMISMIAHQWRQPLAAISSTSAGINLKAKLNKLDKETAVELSSKISGYSQHLSTTIDDFREFFKSNKEKSDTTYSEVIKSTLNIVETAIENQNITVNKNLKSNVVFNTYPNELKQVVLNLIKNAEDALQEVALGNAL
ncbi:MAG: PAS domain S-box protein, partial [Campylobacterota bacterium]|nr:PAS domain S-box protein [Campylobacterota bacterium]